MKRMVPALLLILFAISPCATAQDKSVPNGCGTGWSRYLVPNSIPLLQCQFRAACNAHDSCYSHCEGRTDGDCEYRRCRKDGDLYGETICLTDERLLSLATKAAIRKDACDAKFYDDLVQRNAGRMSCRAFAVIYRDAVKTWGDGPFAGIDQTAALSGQTQQDYEEAIRDFFAAGTEAQFKRIVDADEAGGKAVDMKRPVQFIAGQGLVNRQ